MLAAGLHATRSIKDIALSNCRLDELSLLAIVNVLVRLFLSQMHPK